MSTQRTYAEGETSTIAASVTREGLGPCATSHRYSREPGHCLGRVRGVPSGDSHGACILARQRDSSPTLSGSSRRLAGGPNASSLSARPGMAAPRVPGITAWPRFPIPCPSSGSRTMRCSRRSCSDTFCARPAGAEKLDEHWHGSTDGLAVLRRSLRQPPAPRSADRRAQAAWSAPLSRRTVNNRYDTRNHRATRHRPRRNDASAEARGERHRQARSQRPTPPPAITSLRPVHCRVPRRLCPNCERQQAHVCEDGSAAVAAGHAAPNTATTNASRDEARRWIRSRCPDGSDGSDSGDEVQTVPESRTATDDDLACRRRPGRTPAAAMPAPARVEGVRRAPTEARPGDCRRRPPAQRGCRVGRHHASGRYQSRADGRRWTGRRRIGSCWIAVWRVTSFVAPPRTKTVPARAASAPTAIRPQWTSTSTNGSDEGVNGARSDIEHPRKA